MHSKGWSLLIFGSVLFIMVIKPLTSVSAACTFPSITTPTNIGANDCTVDSGTYTGVDVASGANNVAVLILNNAASHVTVNAGGHLLVGSIQITGVGAYISIQPAVVSPPTPSGEIKLNAALCVTDADSDGYPLNLTLSNSCTGKRRLSLMTSLTILDCNDANPATYANAVCYADADQDTYTSGGGQSVCGGSTCNGTTWKTAANGADCNDANASVFRTVAGYLDADGDGYGAGAYTACAGASGSYVANNTDCKDTGAYAVYVMFSGLTCYYDSDNDNYGQNTARTCMNTQSCATATWGTTGAADDAGNINFSSNNTDCNDSNASIYANISCYANADGDSGYSNVINSFCGSTCAAAGQSTTPGNDCCDTDPLAFYGQTTAQGQAKVGGCSVVTYPAYDFNCDGGETPTITGVNAPCRSCWAECPPTCDGVCHNNDAQQGGSGWTGSTVQACGATAGIRSDVGYCLGGPYPSCPVQGCLTESRTQTCL